MSFFRTLNFPCLSTGPAAPNDHTTFSELRCCSLVLTICHSYVAEDLYSMMLHRPTDNMSHRASGGARVSFRSDEDAVLTLVGNMCREQDALARWSGMYELAPCGGDLATSKNKVCREGQRHFLVRSPGPKSKLSLDSCAPLSNWRTVGCKCAVPEPSEECLTCREIYQANMLAKGFEPTNMAAAGCARRLAWSIAASHSNNISSSLARVSAVKRRFTSQRAAGA